jgi:2-polyprenyl-3-methyl-5-hydroxy-6-metoxy-1,4-benzoquinol methylase
VFGGEAIVKYRKDMNINRTWWNARVNEHVHSDFYAVEEFKAGNTKELRLERAELGAVNGKSLLHLQCHFGLDTLSWARYGAEVTGLDFSNEAIKEARKLAKETNLPAQFVVANVYDAPTKISDRFDIVFTSWGVLGWLPDYETWATVVAEMLNPGGTFYIAELHPFSLIFADNDKEAPSKTPQGKFEYDYFYSSKPLIEETEFSYAAPKTSFDDNDTRYWIFELGAIITHLIDAGLKIEFVHEHDFSCYQQWPAMIKETQDIWRLPKDWPSLPLSFSIKAQKPDT